MGAEQLNNAASHKSAANPKESEIQFKNPLELKMVTACLPMRRAAVFVVSLVPELYLPELSSTLDQEENRLWICGMICASINIFQYLEILQVGKWVANSDPVVESC